MTGLQLKVLKYIDRGKLLDHGPDALDCSPEEFSDARAWLADEGYIYDWVSFCTIEPKGLDALPEEDR